MKDANGTDIGLGDSVAVLHHAESYIGHVCAVNQRDSEVTVDVSKVAMRSGRSATTRFTLPQVHNYQVLVLR